MLVDVGGGDGFVGVELREVNIKVVADISM